MKSSDAGDRTDCKNSSSLRLPRDYDTSCMNIYLNIFISGNRSEYATRSSRASEKRREHRT